MKSKRVMESMERYGVPVTIQVGGEEPQTVSTRAFIQPTRYLNRIYHSPDFPEPGPVDHTTYLYIGPANVRVDTFPYDTVILTDNESFRIQRTHKVAIGDEVLYVWAILQKYVPDEL